MIWESGIETGVLPYVKWEFTVWHKEHKAGALWHPRGWDGRKVRGRFKRQGYMYTHGWFMLMCDRSHHNIVIILQLKIKFKKAHLSPSILYHQYISKHSTIYWERKLMLHSAFSNTCYHKKQQRGLWKERVQEQAHVLPDFADIEISILRLIDQKFSQKDNND